MATGLRDASDVLETARCTALAVRLGGDFTLLFDEFFNFAEQVSPLGNASADSCADYCVTLFSDLTRMVTMQNLYHDGGYSTTGISNEIMEKFSG